MYRDSDFIILDLTHTCSLLYVLTSGKMMTVYIYNVHNSSRIQAEYKVRELSLYAFRNATLVAALKIVSLCCHTFFI